MTCPQCGLSQEEHQGVMDDLQLSDKEVRRLRRANSSLLNKLNEQRADSPLAGEVREVLEHYVTRFQKSKAFKVGPDTARWQLVEKALKADHTVPELKEAIDGLRAFPFVGAQGRQAEGTEDERHDGIEICLRNEIYIDRFRGYIQKARRAVEDAKKAAKPELWPPMERLQLALSDRGLKYDGTWLDGQPEAGKFWRAWGDCPLCLGALRIGVRDNGWATLRCELGCDFFRVLAALGLDPADLTRQFDPATIEKPASWVAAWPPERYAA